MLTKLLDPSARALRKCLSPPSACSPQNCGGRWEENVHRNALSHPRTHSSMHAWHTSLARRQPRTLHVHHRTFDTDSLHTRATCRLVVAMLAVKTIAVSRPDRVERIKDILHRMARQGQIRGKVGVVTHAQLVGHARQCGSFLLRPCSGQLRRVDCNSCC